MSYLLLWLGMTAAIFFVTQLVLDAAIPTIAVLLLSASISAFLVANELKKPQFREYNRSKFLRPPIPSYCLYDKPISESVFFGKDYHTKKWVMAEPGKHVFIIGASGSGKTASCLIGSILSDTTGSKQIVDIKSRELSYKTADINDPKTYIIDVDHRAPYTYGWDIFYALRDSNYTEQEVQNCLNDIAHILVPTPQNGDPFWADGGRNLFLGLAIYSVVYAGNHEFLDVVMAILNTPLREHMERALNTVPKNSLVTSYLMTLSTLEDATLTSIQITLSQALFPFLSEDIQYFLKGNSRRANPKMLDQEGVTQYLCISEEKLDGGYDKIMTIVMKQTLQSLQSRTTSGKYPNTMLYWDEWQRLTSSCKDLQMATNSFLLTARSKHCTVVLAAQGIDGFEKNLIYSILANIHYLLILSSNNANSLTTELAVKQAGRYHEKNVSYTASNQNSTSTSFSQQDLLLPSDLNALDQDAILIITNYGYVRVRKQYYFKTEPFKSKYEKIMAVNSKAMEGV